LKPKNTRKPQSTQFFKTQEVLPTAGYLTIPVFSIAKHLISFPRRAKKNPAKRDFLGANYGE